MIYLRDALSAVHRVARAWQNVPKFFVLFPFLHGDSG